MSFKREGSLCKKKTIGRGVYARGAFKRERLFIGENAVCFIRNLRFLGLKHCIFIIKEIIGPYKVSNFLAFYAIHILLDVFRKSQ